MSIINWKTAVTQSRENGRMEGEVAMNILDFLDVKRSEISCEGCGDRKPDESTIVFRKGEFLDVKVIGSGDEDSRKLLENAEKAIERKDADASVEFITSIEKAFELGVLGTPALMINGKVLSSSRVMTAEEIMAHIGL